jgi:predicted Na+-dependent transporter
MKLKHLLSIIAIGAIVYLLSAFVAADFDFRNWYEFGRMMCVSVFIGLSFGYVMFSELK